MNITTQKKLAVIGLSGGVDSSVALWLLQQQGYAVEAVFMKNWEEDDKAGYCHASQDLKDASSVCDMLKVKLHEVNFARDYWDRVFTRCLNELSFGATPNPDIWCNKEIKFNAMLHYAKNLGAEYLATGHYAKNCYSNNQYLLMKSQDHNKDQTYFLYGLDQAQLKHALFPLADLTKASVRKIATDLKLPTSNKKDSTGICFIGERRFKSFIERFLPNNPGNIINIDGEILGRHDGLMYYTIGQRQGLKIGGTKSALAAPWYVASKDLSNNTLTVVQGKNNAKLFNNTLIATELNWIAYQPQTNTNYTAKIRYRQLEQACTITKLTPAECHVTFIEPQRAVTVGQSIVFYENDTCLGGGIIQHVI